MILQHNKYPRAFLNEKYFLLLWKKTHAIYNASVVVVKFGGRKIGSWFVNRVCGQRRICVLILDIFCLKLFLPKIIFA
jgi:hypothetical protein